MTLSITSTALFEAAADIVSYRARDALKAFDDYDVVDDKLIDKLESEESFLHNPHTGESYI
eukprot:1126008-Pleurochrysis_carterae.AAC.1